MMTTRYNVHKSNLSKIRAERLRKMTPFDRHKYDYLLKDEV